MTTTSITEKKISNTLIVLAGPTAAGKTALAADVAQILGCDVISADSRQIFKELEIGTARPGPEDLAKATHHFAGSHSLYDRFNAGDFEKEGLALLETLFKKNPVQVMAGGSGLYIQALLNGLDEFTSIPEDIRVNLRRMYESEGIQTLRDLLQTQDPKYHAQVDLHNPQRMLRALEVCLASGRPYSTFTGKKQVERSFKAIKFCVFPGRDELYARINSRVEQMMQNGLLEEASVWSGQRQLNGLHTVGYTELFDYLDGKTDLPAATRLIAQHTRNYAKRQLTWFRKDPDYYWIEPHNLNKVLDSVRHRSY